jgi:eukaryotic-like serine/threonine-protein kinase
MLSPDHAPFLGNELSADLGKYRLLGKVGHGGMAVVYRALDKDLNREVAIKVLHHHLADSVEAKDRFAREARAVAKLRHPNILEIYDYAGADNTASNHSFIVTEFIDGQTLKQFVTQCPIVFPEIAAMICLQIARALEHAHNASVMHRDIKPENVMIRRDGAVKLMDFGISHMVDLERLTVTGQLLGSPAYMAPEHVDGKPIDYRTDVFALGTVLYQLCTGNLPFVGKNAHEVLRKIADGKFTDPRHANPAINNPLGRIILKSMAAAPDQRYQSVTAFVDALFTFCQDSGIVDTTAELSVYFADPARYDVAFSARLADNMATRGLQLMTSHPATALDAFDRALVCNPTHERALAGVARMRRTTTGKTVVWVVAGAVAVTAIALTLARKLTSTVAIAPTSHEETISDTVELPALSPSLASTARVTLPIDNTNVAVIQPAKPAATSIAVPAKEPRPPPTTQTATPTPRQTVSLQLSPPGSEFRVDDGQWQTAQSGRYLIEVANAPVRLSVRNDACCEAKSRVVTSSDAGTTVSVALAFLPAQITALCDSAESVRIDGKAARIGSPALVPFGETTKTQRQVKVEFVGKNISTKTITIRPASNIEVTCDAS